MTALDIRGLRVLRGGRAILDGVTLDVADGGTVCLVGPSGCGKSTLLRAIAGLLPPDGGAIEIFGRPAAFVPAEAGIVFQDDALLPWRTARENVALGLRFRGRARGDADNEASRWLARVGLRGLDGRYPHELSGGMRKRVAIAQVLAPQPRLLLMDEPFASLDAIVRTILLREFAALVRAERLSVLHVTHDLEEAIVLGDRVAVMSAGPGARIATVYPVPFAWPRDPIALRADPAFGALLAQVWSDLAAEVADAGWTVPAT